VHRLEIRSDDGSTARHGFDHRVPESFPSRGEQQDIVGAVEIFDLGNGLDDADTITQPVLDDRPLDLALQLPAPRNRE